MHLDKLKELSLQTPDTVEVKERIQRVEDICTVVDRIRSFGTLTYPYSKSARTRKIPVPVELADMKDNDDNPYKLVAVVSKSRWEDVPSIRLFNTYENNEGRDSSRWGDQIATIPVTTFGSDWDVKVHTRFGDIDFENKDAALEDLHSTVMAIGDAASNADLNPDLADFMDDVMEQVRH